MFLKPTNSEFKENGKKNTSLKGNRITRQCKERDGFPHLNQFIPLRIIINKKIENKKNYFLKDWGSEFLFTFSVNKHLPHIYIGRLFLCTLQTPKQVFVKQFCL